MAVNHDQPSYRSTRCSIVRFGDSFKITRTDVGGSVHIPVEEAEEIGAVLMNGAEN